MEEKNNKGLSDKKLENPLYTTNIITCNKTRRDGSVVNVLEDNAEAARKRVDEIEL